ncbi:MAG: plasmid pRiA4b ORF-3 family protein [Rhodobacteraceae bacterium]|nr:plasmid pRiA4b ORF-3 family protein [Paracoccaceae bacterium]
MSEVPQIYQLKVRLLGISPMIWRRVRVLDSTTLRELHGILQVAMGWEGLHLYVFEIYAVQYGAFELHVASPDVALRDFGFRERDRFSYIYDMGDYWAHEIRMETMGPAGTRPSVPRCTGGSRSCPPEECGGPPGYRARRDDANGFEAWEDLGTMVAWLSDLAGRETTGLTVQDVLTDDVEATLQRVVARGPYVEETFSRRSVNDRFRAGDHRDFMHQQL